MKNEIAIKFTKLTQETYPYPQNEFETLIYRRDGHSDVYGNAFFSEKYNKLIFGEIFWLESENPRYAIITVTAIPNIVDFRFGQQVRVLGSDTHFATVEKINVAKNQILIGWEEPLIDEAYPKRKPKMIKRTWWVSPNEVTITKQPANNETT